MIKKRSFIGNLRKYPQLYLMMLPCILFLFIFKYVPMTGIVIAFKEYMPWNGLKAIFTDEWVGLKYFKTLFSNSTFTGLLKNSLSISLLKLAVGFPAPIILALLLNEVQTRKFKRLVQTVTYLPHFLSWVVIYGILYNLLNASYGTVNTLIKNLGGETIAFLSEPEWLYLMLVLSSVWKSVGYSSVIYLAALTSIDQELYEAAITDGAGRFRMMVSITIPLIMPICAMMLCLSIGNLLGNDFQQLLMFVRNDLQKKIGNTFEIHTYEQGILKAKYSYATAVGLFQSVVGMMLVIPANKFAKKLGYMGLY